MTDARGFAQQRAVPCLSRRIRQLSSRCASRYLTPVSGSGGNVFVGKLDANMQDDTPHAYVPNLAAQGSGYTFSDSSGVAQRLLGIGKRRATANRQAGHNFIVGLNSKKRSVDASLRRGCPFAAKFKVLAA